MLTKVSFSSIALAGILSATLANASGEVSSSGPSLYNSGFYTGALLGYSSMNSSIRESLFSPGLLNSSKNLTGNSQGIVGDLLLGYRHFFKNKYMLGFEFGFSANNNELNNKFLVNNFNIQTKLKGQYKFTPSVVIGTQLSSKWLGFIKLGVSMSRFKGYHSLYLPGSGEGADIRTFSSTKTGFMGALGAEYAINEKISTIALASYESFGSISSTFKENIFGFPNETTTIKMKPEYYTFKVGMTYSF
ncbi:MAG: hypothetical protein B7Y25_03675 [Alphaproteobacteria bacterium 16-39-46]|nr:MAG: hypothetical protein B7Y25_03675 [Alphaproteobacteria bacterium 16-39-46]OZA43204.1 MAG: hypothetical protein B7X84_03900 [Alphaproteobacteria bacterium 17-39-52]HQS84088.1 outer membrane beta-barrel protein [Alphaproteobacteria bacterium]HQS94403.1 outer membrane beta-barrel protein [Alphaproteobacteria bacterium]